MPLTYLDFDYSEDSEGDGTFDAIASVPHAQAAGLMGEIARVLGWAHGLWPDGCAPLDEGGIWHYDLQGVQEVHSPLAFEFNAAGGELNATLCAATPPRTTVHFTVSGRPDFCAEFRAAFAVP